MDEKWPNDQFFALVEKELEEGKTVKIRLKGNSMFPILRSGRDSVILQKFYYKMGKRKGNRS